MKPYYQEKNITIYNGDCLEVMKEFPDKYFDYCLTSPPYNLIRPLKMVQKYYNYCDNKDPEIYKRFLINVIYELLRVTKKYILFNIMYVSQNKKILFELIGELSNYIKDVLIWQKPFQPALHKNVLTHNYEFIFVFSENNKRSYDIDFGNKGNCRTCFFARANDNTNPLRFNNKNISAVMSIQLAKYLIGLFSKKHTTILDPFLGSGTTARACKDLGRKCIGIEISEEYCSIAVQRLAQEVLPL